MMQLQLQLSFSNELAPSMIIPNFGHYGSTFFNLVKKEAATAQLQSTEKCMLQNCCKDMGTTRAHTNDCARKISLKEWSLPSNEASVYFPWNFHLHYTLLQSLLDLLAPCYAQEKNGSFPHRISKRWSPAAYIPFYFTIRRPACRRNIYQ